MLISSHSRPEWIMQSYQAWGPVSTSWLLHAVVTMQTLITVFQNTHSSNWAPYLSSSLFYAKYLWRRMHPHYYQSWKTINTYDHKVQQIFLRMGRGILYFAILICHWVIFLLAAKFLQGNKLTAMKKLI